MKKICLRSCLTSPYLWALAGTPAPPLNILYVLVFCLVARLRRLPGLGGAMRCLNVQLTYTLVFFVPIAVAIAISASEAARSEVPISPLHRLVTGFPLGVISLAGILLLAFFNVRSFAENALKIPFQEIPRLKFLRETPKGVIL